MLFCSTPLGMKRVLCVPSNSSGKGKMGESKAQNRIQPVDPQRATGKARRLLGQVRAKFGLVPNVFRVLSNAPVALQGYLHLTEALAGGTFDAKVREQMALAVAESNLCVYCRSAHTFLGEKAGLTPDEIANAIRACAPDPRTDALLKLARSIVVQRGEVSDADLQRARLAGLTDCEVVETVANVALNIFANYVNHVARTAVDFAESKSAQAAPRE